MTTFDLRRARLRPGERWQTRLPVRIEPLEYGGQRYTPVPPEPEAELALTRTSGGHVFELALDVRLEGACMRCLADAALDLRVRAREYHEQGAASEELRSPYLDGDRLDLSGWARDAVALSLPDKILCREDCAGLCPTCGARLEDGPCGCVPPEPASPFAKLAELRDRLAD